MPRCTKCGATVTENAAFCPNCGAPQGGAPVTAQSNAMTQTGIKENLAGLLCYVLGWLAGLIFLIIDKRSFVQFHARQSIVLFGGLSILRIVLGMFAGIALLGGGVGSGFSSAAALFDLLYLLGVVLWIICMIKAYQGERFRVPVAVDLADRLFGKA